MDVIQPLRLTYSFYHFFKFGLTKKLNRPPGNSLPMPVLDLYDLDDTSRLFFTGVDCVDMLRTVLREKSAQILCSLCKYLMCVSAKMS